MYILPYLSILLTASAVYVPLHPRTGEAVFATTAESQNTGVLDGPTSDGTAEALEPSLRGQIIAQRTGTNFELTADTGADEGKLTAEYILNGKNIKVGSGAAAKAGAAAYEDLIKWNPWAKNGEVTVDIANSKCNPWTVNGLKKETDVTALSWFPQITTPMPLEAIYNLMLEQEREVGDLHILNGYNSHVDDDFNEFLVVVTQDYFASNTNNIDKSKVTDDVLGFCSLVLSYAKSAATPLGIVQSPKLRTTFMPRTEFNTIYKQVKSKIPGDLFTLFNSLACYKTVNKNAVVDSTYCTGTLEKAVPNNRFGALTYKNPKGSVNIKSWIEGIGKESPSPDLLTKFDQSIDGSIGGLLTKTEKMYDSTRSVPLFEFRDLDPIPATAFESFMAKVDSSIQALHKKFKTSP